MKWLLQIEVVTFSQNLFIKGLKDCWNFPEFIHQRKVVAISHNNYTMRILRGTPLSNSGTADRNGMKFKPQIEEHSPGLLTKFGLYQTIVFGARGCQSLKNAKIQNGCILPP